jgi:hypothetical protein
MSKFQTDNETNAFSWLSAPFVFAVILASAGVLNKSGFVCCRAACPGLRRPLGSRRRAYHSARETTLGYI